MKMMAKTVLKTKTNSLFRAAQNGNHAHSRSTCALIKVCASNRLIMSNLTHLNESHHRRIIDMSKFKMPSLIRFFWGSGISEMFEISDERIKQSIEMIDSDLTIDVSANFRPLSTGAWFAIFSEQTSLNENHCSHSIEKLGKCLKSSSLFILKAAWVKSFDSLNPFQAS